jgi:hypothetical protein
MAKTAEQKTAEAILQKPKDVVIGGVTYEVAPPSTATLILVSELVSQLPDIEINKDSDIISESLRIARHCKGLGEIAATMILGAKELSKHQLFGNKLRKLSSLLLTDLTPKKLSSLVVKLLAGMETSDFFGITVSLIEINLTKQTRETVKKTTASGQ